MLCSLGDPLETPGPGDSSGATAGVLDSQPLGSVPALALTNDTPSISSSVQRGYNPPTPLWVALRNNGVCENIFKVHSLQEKVPL